MLLVAGAVQASAGPSRRVVFPTSDGGEIHGDLFGAGPHGVVLAHGAVFDRQSWRGLAEILAGAGLQALAFDFRGYGESTPGSQPTALYRDVLGAVSFLQGGGVERISLVGASMGGRAVAEAATRVASGELHKVVLLAPAPFESPAAIAADELLFVAAEGEHNLSRIRELYRRAPEPKDLVLLRGDAHAQHLFHTDQADRLTEILLEFLAE